MAADASCQGRPPGVVSSLKRKAPSSSSQSPQTSRSRKRFKLQDARMIAAQTNTQAFDNGEIDVDKFVKARAYEITALEAGIRSSKKALSARAFQNVPRDLRRRTASHNVKRVPKRLRSRAAREVSKLIFGCKLCGTEAEWCARRWPTTIPQTPLCRSASRRCECVCVWILLPALTSYP